MVLVVKLKVVCLKFYLSVLKKGELEVSTILTMQTLKNKDVSSRRGCWSWSLGFPPSQGSGSAMWSELA